MLTSSGGLYAKVQQYHILPDHNTSFIPPNDGTSDVDIVKKKPVETALLEWVRVEITMHYPRVANLPVLDQYLCAGEGYFVGEVKRRIVTLQNIAYVNLTAHELIPSNFVGLC